MKTIFSGYRIFLRGTKQITEGFIPKDLVKNELEAQKMFYSRMNLTGGKFREFEYQAEKGSQDFNI